ncbi:MAG TPA: metalloregulator ArsR/SmtB family transcription factor [Caulobacteraceae bacterium]|nr:metalloregulator ArsR/SmtB family transcription factor [Caulobacteraceae bacterium]
MNVYEALAEPHRRRIIELVGNHERTAGEIVDALAISQPGVSKHLRILREAGLVNVRKDAQRRLYSLRPDKLAELDAWLAPYRRFWSGKLDALVDHLMKEQ